MTTSVRGIIAGDYEDWLPLFEDYLAFYQTSRPREVLETVFARMVSGREHEFRGLCAVREGDIVGITHFVGHRKMWDVADTLYLQDLYVVAEHRCSGVARALIEAVYTIAATEGASSVYWLTQENNHTAQALYDRLATKTDFIKYNHQISQ